MMMCLISSLSSDVISDFFDQGLNPFFFSRRYSSNIDLLILDIFTLLTRLKINDFEIPDSIWVGVFIDRF